VRNSAAGSASFNSKAAAVGRAETGSSRLSGLFGLSGSPKREQVFLVCLGCPVH